MTPFDALVIEVPWGNIRVSLAGSSYAVTYHKPRNSPQLLAKTLPVNEDQNAPITGGPECSNYRRRVPGSRLESGQRQGSRNGLDPIRKALPLYLAILLWLAACGTAQAASCRSKTFPHQTSTKSRTGFSMSA